MTTRFAELRCGRTAFDVVGEGQALLLLHGAEANRNSLQHLAQALAPHATVVAHDQRGCGDTQSTGEAHSVLDLADDAAELMAQLGHERYTVFGTSLGGRIAQALSQRHRAQLVRLMLCNTWPLSLTLAEVNPEGAATLQDLRAGLPGTAPELAAMFYTPEHVAAHPELAQRFARPSAKSHRSALARETHPTPRLPEGTVLISGQRDAIVPSAVMRVMAEPVVAGNWCVMAGVGHSAAVQAPQLLAQHIAEHLPS